MCSPLFYSFAPEFVDILLGHKICPGQQARGRWFLTGYQVIEQPNGRIMSLSEGLLPDGAGNYAFLHELHGLINETSTSAMRSPAV